MFLAEEHQAKRDISEKYEESGQAWAISQILLLLHTLTLDNKSKYTGEHLCSYKMCAGVCGHA